MPLLGRGLAQRRLPADPTIGLPPASSHRGAAGATRIVHQPSSSNGPQVEAALRLGLYGDHSLREVAPTRHGLGEDGSYLVASSGVAAIGGAGFVLPAFGAYTDASPILYIYNRQGSGGKSVYLDYLRIISTTDIGSIQNASFYAWVLDQGARSVTTNHFTKVTPALTNLAGRVDALVPQVLAQNSATASVVSASTKQATLIGRGQWGLNITGDTAFQAFGVTDVGANTANTTLQLTGGRIGSSQSCDGPAIIPPGWNAALYFWSQDGNTPDIEFILGMWMR